jgi:glucuronate isomerase
MDRRAFLALPLVARAASRALFTRVHRSLERVSAVDTHEHIIAEADRVSQPIDFFTLAGHYAINDVISAGLPKESQELIDSPTATAEQKWRAFEPYWKYARSTGYGETLQIAIRDIYGFEAINGQTISEINSAIGARNKPGLYKDILKKRARLDFCVNDQYWRPNPEGVDPEFFVLAQKFDGFVMPISRDGITRLEKTADASITNLAALKSAMAKTFERALEVGMVTVKSTAAYQRDLKFEEVSESDAARDFERLMRGEETAPEGFRVLSNRPYRQLADHMFHHLVQLADAHNVPFQIHTGLQAGNGNFVENTRPSLLNNLFLLYPRVKFDLFHIGYPYAHEVTALAKMFPNVYIDFCWMHILSPSAARRALNEMLDAVPANKLFGFGGDYRYPELSYAHLVIARRNIATVLSDRVEAGTCTEEEAAELGRWILRDNPAALFSPKKT